MRRVRVPRSRDLLACRRQTKIAPYRLESLSGWTTAEDTLELVQRLRAFELAPEGVGHERGQASRGTAAYSGARSCHQFRWQGDRYPLRSHGVGDYRRRG